MKKVTSIVLALTMLLLFALISSCENQSYPTENNQISARESLYRIGTEAEPCGDQVDLVTGRKHDKVGVVNISNDDEFLYVQYLLDGDEWCITETHVQVAKTAAVIPQAKGNAVPGQFDYKEEHDPCVTEYTHIIPLSDIEGNVDCEDDYLAIAAHAVVKNKTTCSDPVVLLATENNHPTSGTTIMEARIYSITTTGITNMISNIYAPVRDTDTDNFNGNAYDALNNRFYFTDFGKYGKPYNQGPSPLYFNDLVGNQSLSGTLAGGAACGTIYNGKYYYISTRTDDLYEVTLNPNGTVYDETQLADIFGNSGKVLAFGDIDIRNEAGIDVIYGSATELNPTRVVFFKMNLDGTGYTVIKTGSLYGAGGTQIAFGSDGILYGVNARTPYDLFSINTTNGSTSLIKNIGVGFSDLASGPVCEPQEETAWGEGPGFPGKDWSMYFDYEICCEETPPPYAECKLYLSESFSGTNDGSIIYTVDVSDNTYAHLTEEIDLTGRATWDKPHLAVDPVSGLLYLINNGNDCHLGTWNGASFIDLGAVSGLPDPSNSNPGTVLAAFSDDGRLFVANAKTEKIYEIDPTVPTVIADWDTGIDISGADMAFIGNDLFIWTNSNKTLYKITSLNSDGSVTKETVGKGSAGFTGLAYGGCTNGKLLGSSNTDDKLYAINTSNGSTSAAYPFKLDEKSYDHIYGDMASGH